MAPRISATIAIGMWQLPLGIVFRLEYSIKSFVYGFFALYEKLVSNLLSKIKVQGYCSCNG